MNNIDRKNSIGGSDIASVMGLSRWKSPLQLWAEKTGKIESKDLSEVEAVQLGIELEDFVARKFAATAGLKVRRDRRTFKHPDYDYMVAHIDRRIVGTDKLLECKTCSAYKDKEWEGEEIPQEYILQTIWYEGLLGMSRGYLAVLIGGQKFIWKDLEFDKELYEQMVAKAKDFWEINVKQDIPPIATAGDGDTLLSLYKDTSENILTLDEEQQAKVNLLLTQRQEAMAYIKANSAVKDDIESKIKQMLGECIIGETEKFKFTWKSQENKRLDTARIKVAGLYDKYLKKDDDGNIPTIRVLRVNKRKELKNGKPGKS